MGKKKKGLEQEEEVVYKYKPLKPTKVTKTEQAVPEEVLSVQDVNIMRCYEHFADRYATRYRGIPLTYHEYLIHWVKCIRGDEFYRDNFSIWTTIGHYIRDEHIYEVVYRKIFKYDIYVPITIYEITMPGMKCKRYRKILKDRSQEQNRDELPVLDQ